MTARKIAARPADHRQSRDERLKDEVYRHMFRLEAKRSGADLDLAVALLRAWLALESGKGRPAMREWLRKICPICLSLIETPRASHGAGSKCIP